MSRLSYRSHWDLAPTARASDEMSDLRGFELKNARIKRVNRSAKYNRYRRCPFTGQHRTWFRSQRTADRTSLDLRGRGCAGLSLARNGAGMDRKETTRTHSVVAFDVWIIHQSDKTSL